MLTSKRSWKKVVPVLLVAAIIGVMSPAPAPAETVYWETDYMLIRFEWNGTWDNAAYWAYGMYLLDIPDWAYLFAVYGMGWDHIWGSAFWGSNGTWGSEDKLEVSFVVPWGGNTLYEYYDGYMERMALNLDPSLLPSLDLVGGGWVNTMCTVGRGIAYWTTSKMSMDYFIAGASVAGADIALSCSLALHVANVLWPWGDHVLANGYDVSVLSGIQAGYQNYHPFYGTENWPSFDDWNFLMPFYLTNYPPTVENDDKMFSALGIGYLLTDYDHLILGAPDAGGASGNYRNAIWLTWLKNHDNDCDGAMMAAYAHGLDLSWPHSWVVQVDPKYNRMEAWLFYVMWGYWYDYPLD